MLFECEYYDSNWKNIGSIYTCQATVIHSDCEPDLVDVFGEHESERNNSHVAGFSVQEEVLNHLPSNLAHFFPNLKGISIINSNLLTLEAKDLKPFRGLLHLRLLANSLTTLKGDLFKFTLSLRYIDFQRNLIQRVGYGLLKDLQPVVEVADFSNNICINSCASLPRIYGWETAFIRFVTLLEENCIAKSEMLTTEPPPTPDCRLIDSTNISGECSLRCSLGKEVDEIKSEVTELGKLVKEFGSIPATP